MQTPQPPVLCSLIDEDGSIIGLQCDFKRFLKNGASPHITHALVGYYPNEDGAFAGRDDQYIIRIVPVERVFLDVPLDTTGQTGHN